MTIEQAKESIGKKVRSTFRVENGHCPLPVGTAWQVESVIGGEDAKVRVFPLHRLYAHLDAPMEFSVSDFVPEEEWKNHPLCRRRPATNGRAQAQRDFRALFGTCPGLIRGAHETLRIIGFVFESAAVDGRKVPVHVQVDGIRDLQSGLYGSVIRFSDANGNSMAAPVNQEPLQASLHKALRVGVAKALALLSELFPTGPCNRV